MSKIVNIMQSFFGLCVRALLPFAILAGGWLAYVELAVEVEKEPPEPEEETTLRTQVVDLEVCDYPVVVTTYGVVQSHNQSTLTSEVSGIITYVSPSFEVGAYFSEGEVLVEIDQRDYETALAMAEARHLAAKSALELAKLDEERKLRLVSSNAVSQAEADTASATREQAEAEVESAAAQMQQDELALQRTKVRAPFDGRVQLKNVGLGQMAGPNTPLGQVFAIDYAEVRLPISGRQRQYLDLPEFADDPPVEVTLRDAISETSESVWPAKIVRTEGVLDENSRDLYVIARIDDPFGRKTGRRPLRIGQPVVASIEGHVLDDVIALPRVAVRQLDRILLVDQAEQTLTPLRIEPVWSDAEHVVVEQSTIPEGKWLATTHLVFAPAGTKVEIIPDIEPQTSIASSASGQASAPAAQ